MFQGTAIEGNQKPMNTKLQEIEKALKELQLEIERLLRLVRK